MTTLLGNRLRLPRMLRNGDFAGLDDRGVCCTEGDLIQASRTFMRPDPDVRSSPWLRVTPRLWTIDEARERVRAYAETAWAAAYATQSKTGTMIDGKIVYDERRNPFEIKEPVPQG